MNCPTCGATLTEGTTTCPTCGAAISQPADFNQMQYQQPETNFNQAQYQQPQANYNQHHTSSLRQISIRHNTSSLKQTIIRHSISSLRQITTRCHMQILLPMPQQVLSTSGNSMPDILQWWAEACSVWSPSFFRSCLFPFLDTVNPCRYLRTAKMASSFW